VCFNPVAAVSFLSKTQDVSVAIDTDFMKYLAGRPNWGSQESEMGGCAQGGIAENSAFYGDS